MVFCTGTADAPWTIVRSNEKRRARIAATRHLLHTLPCDGKDASVAHAPDPLIVRSTAHVPGISAQILGKATRPVARRRNGA